MRRLSGLMLCVALVACRDPMDLGDAGVPDAGRADAGPFDAGPFDAGPFDAGPFDAGPFDAGPFDAGIDAGPFDAGPDLRCPARAAGVPDGGLLRIIAGNLSSGNLQSWTPGEGARILKGLKPDVALMQEFNIGTNSEVDRRAFVDSTFGPDFCFHIEAGATIPNGIVTRWPILDAGQWVDAQVSNRSFAWAQIDVPGPRDLWAVSVHLLTMGSQRPAEAQALVALVNQFVPAGGLLVIGGDFNTGTRSETAITTLGAVVHIAAPQPVDQSNNGNTNASRSAPYDWVMPDPDLFALQVPVVVGAATFDAGLVFDSRVFNPLSAVAPVQAGDSASQNMQHMAVVKDFLLP